MFSAKTFDLQDAAFGRGPRFDDRPLEALAMSHETGGCRAPVWPEPQVLAAHEGALATLRQALTALRGCVAGDAVESIELGALRAADRSLVDQVLGAGEVAAHVMGSGAIQAQESVFAGLWRVVYREDGAVLRETLEVGAFPRAVAAAAHADGRPIAPLPSLRPADAPSASAVLAALRERAVARRSGDPAYVVNLSLLPLSRGDGELFEQQLGRGRVAVLSSGYGNCRIVNTHAAGVWRVSYFNSQDQIILDTLEVADVPEVACAALQDVEDSAERLHEVLRWVDAS